MILDELAKHCIESCDRREQHLIDVNMLVYLQLKYPLLFEDILISDFGLDYTNNVVTMKPTNKFFNLCKEFYPEAMI